MASTIKQGYAHMRKARKLLKAGKCAQADDEYREVQHVLDEVPWDSRWERLWQVHNKLNDDIGACRWRKR